MTTHQELFALQDRVRELEAHLDELVTQNAELAATNDHLIGDRAQTHRAARALATFGSADAYHTEMQRLRAERAALDGEVN